MAKFVINPARSARISPNLAVPTEDLLGLSADIIYGNSVALSVRQL